MKARRNLYGYVYNKQGNPLSNALVILKDDNFQDIQCTHTDKEGKYNMLVEEGRYPFLMIVKDYADKYLEFWGHNLNISKDIEINATIDTLEVYGLNCFCIKGGCDIPTLSIYFRPMSLEKYKKGEDDISPNIDAETINVFINEQPCKVLVVNEVKEYASSLNLKGYLVQVASPTLLKDKETNYLRVRIVDKDTSALGEASLYF